MGAFVDPIHNQVLKADLNNDAILLRALAPGARDRWLGSPGRFDDALAPGRDFIKRIYRGA
ncbi:MAG: hypothetical protein GY913_22530 [Proteobacteria bacterium]|nr:hypothetical protein [Pseudomonadota bacterium]